MQNFSISFNPNQFLLFRNFQTKVCRLLLSESVKCAPFFPLMIFCSELSETSRISQIQIEDFLIEDVQMEELSCKKNPGNERPENESADQSDGQTEKKAAQKFLSIIFKIHEEQKILEGKMLLVKILENTEKNVSVEVFNEEFCLLKSQIKKISPFKLCRTELEQADNSTKWRILSEKWFKPRVPATSINTF